MTKEEFAWFLWFSPGFHMLCVSQTLGTCIGTYGHAILHALSVQEKHLCSGICIINPEENHGSV